MKKFKMKIHSTRTFFQDIEVIAENEKEAEKIAYERASCQNSEIFDDYDIDETWITEFEDKKKRRSKNENI